MIQYFLRRLLALPVILLGANFLGYAYAYYVAPYQLARNPYASQQIKMQPLLPDYWEYLQGVTRGDFGVMYNGEAIDQAIWRASQTSLVLLAISLSGSILVGVLLGMISVRSEPPRVAHWLTAFATAGVASPSFFVGAVLITASVIFLFNNPFGLTKPLLPFQGYGWDEHLVLPVLALMLRPSAQIAQVTSGLLVDELRKQYIVAARSFGHSQRSIRWRYAFRNMLAPVVLTCAGALRLLVAELIIIERLFGWPGIGKLLSTTLVLNSATDNFLSPPLVGALLTTLALMFLLSDMIASLLVRYYDPRLRSA